MGARNGREFISKLDATPRELWLGDEKITGGVSTHPAFKSIASTMASLYEMQMQPELLDVMTYVSPTSGDRVGMSFLQPKTREDVAKRTAMMKVWADFSGGMVGRSADYLNSALMAMASARGFFAKDKIDFGQNVQDYYEYVRENDLLLTHTLVNPQVNRSVGPSKQGDPAIAARVVERTSKGVLIRGARMLATLPIADEILVFPSTFVRTGQDDTPYANAFALPVSAKGLKFICRESFVQESGYDHPLASRFDEQDAVVVFDNVLVPWNRLFLLEDAERANKVNETTEAVVFMAQQAAVREVGKAEFMLGMTTLIAESIGADQFPHVQEKISEMIMTVETLKAFLRAGESNAKVNEWGIMAPDYVPINSARNLWPKVAPMLAVVVKQVAAGGLMANPPGAIMNSEMRPDVEKYFQSKLGNADERLRLFKLAWDAVGSSFGGRQELYERFFFGDPVRMASAYYNWYDKEPYKKRVKEFLQRDAGEKQG